MNDDGTIQGTRLGPIRAEDVAKSAMSASTGLPVQFDGKPRPRKHSMTSPCGVQELVQQAPPEIPAQHVMELTPSGVEPLVLGDDGVGLYSVKGPFVQSGKSTRAKFLMDPVTEKLQCHECGQYFFSPLLHAALAHGRKGRKYRRVHGFRCNSVAESPAVRRAQNPPHLIPYTESHREKLRNDAAYREQSVARMRKGMLAAIRERGSTRSGSLQNEMMLCRAQCERDIRELNAMLGQPPTLAEIKKLKNISRAALRYAFNMPANEVVSSLLGLRPYRGGGLAKWDKSSLIEEVRNFRVSKGRLPTVADFSAGSLPSVEVFYRNFGSLREAFEAAGFANLHRQMLRDTAIRNLKTRAKVAKSSNA